MNVDQKKDDEIDVKKLKKKNNKGIGKSIKM